MLTVTRNDQLAAQPEVDRTRLRRSFGLCALALLVLVAGCSGSGRRIATPGQAPTVAPAQSESSVQGLYESGRYSEVLNSLRAVGDNPAVIWFAAQSHLRLGQRDEAARLFARLPTAGATPAWQAVSDLALALLNGDTEAIDRARAAAAGFPADPFVQFELGLAHSRRSDFAAAAQAFDQCVEADPRFAYAYYNAGLTYDRLKRIDLTITRLETFQRLAPDAPETPEVSSILRTVRGN
jgi:tetratricopeptide (TPR) repeat protein